MNAAQSFFEIIGIAVVVVLLGFGLVVTVVKLLDL
jgi:hypothetical protein